MPEGNFRHFFMKLLSPAKINLFLKIFNKRSDGYHNLATLMQTVSFFDSVEVDFAPKDEFFCSHENLKMDQNNLCIKALNLFRHETKLLDPVKIYLEKNIPMGAGLGGGSSNAATVLFSLSKLFNVEINLIELGSKLGSDVPFFFTSGFAFAFGRGANLIPLKQMNQQTCYLYFPCIHIPTPKVFSLFKTKDHHQTEWDLLKGYFNGDLETFNDLEPLALKYENELVKHHDRLLSCGFKRVLMTGSGSTFVIYDDIKPDLIKDLNLKKVDFIERQDNSWYQNLI